MPPSAHRFTGGCQKACQQGQSRAQAAHGGQRRRCAPQLPANSIQAHIITAATAAAGLCRVAAMGP